MDVLSSGDAELGIQSIFDAMANKSRLRINEERHRERCVGVWLCGFDSRSHHYEQQLAKLNRIGIVTGRMYESA